MNRSIRQAVASLRKALRAGDWRSHDVHLREALRLLSPPKAAPQKSLPKHLSSTKPERKAAHRMSTKEIRAAVRERAGGKCECCGREFYADNLSRRPELDHWASGSGRRREQQSIENTWALARWCHWNRTHNVPSAAFWNERWRQHCATHGYAFTPHVEHAQVERRRPSGPSPVHAQGVK